MLPPEDTDIVTVRKKLGIYEKGHYDKVYKAVVYVACVHQK